MDNQNSKSNIERLFPGAVDFLRKLIQIPTVNPPGEHYERCARFLSKELLSLGFKSEIYKVPDGRGCEIVKKYLRYPRYNVFGRRDIGATQTVHFNAHFDVVPVSDGWSHSPFGGIVKDDIIYGRGSADMKGSIAALILALRMLEESARDPAFNIEVSFVSDEESGGQLGSGWLIQSGIPKADYAVVCEGSSDHKVGIGHNGVLWFKGTVEGKAAHASMPHKGINAFEQMAALVRFFPEYREYLRKKVFRPEKHISVRPTINPGGIFGHGKGGKINTVPGFAWFGLDRRLVPGENIDEVEREIQQFFQKSGQQIEGFSGRLEKKLAINSYHLDRFDPLVTAFASVLGKEFDRPAGIGFTSGFTDAHYFGRELGIPTIGYGVGGQNIHGTDEHLPLENLRRTARVYAEFMQNPIG